MLAMLWMREHCVAPDCHAGLLTLECGKLPALAASVVFLSNATLHNEELIVRLVYFEQTQSPTTS